MSRTLIFWIVMVLWGLNLIGLHTVHDWPTWTNVVGLFLLIGLLGWEVYGPAVRGK
jgi:hypothetical protein